MFLEKRSIYGLVFINITFDGNGLLYSLSDRPTRFFKGPLQCATAIYKERGLLGFYKGSLAMAYREVPSYGIYCLTYEFLSAKMHQHQFTDARGIVADLISGGVAGSLTWLSIIPFDVMKSRFQADFAGE